MYLMDENSKTLRSYNSGADSYIAGTPSIVTGDVKVWLDKSLSLLKPGSSILEIGSAFGRDATYMQRKGFSVFPTDGSKSFVKFMETQKLKAKLLNAITDDLDGPYDMIYANAVLLHFTTKQVENVLDKIHGALKKRGILSFSVKKGNGSEWTTQKIKKPRFFQYWQDEDLINLIDTHGFDLVELTHGSNDLGDFKWLQVVARKRDPR